MLISVARAGKNTEKRERESKSNWIFSRSTRPKKSNVCVAAVGKKKKRRIGRDCPRGQDQRHSPANRLKLLNDRERQVRAPRTVARSFAAACESLERKREREREQESKRERDARNPRPRSRLLSNCTIIVAASDSRFKSRPARSAELSANTGYECGDDTSGNETRATVAARTYELARIQRVLTRWNFRSAYNSSA